MDDRRPRLRARQGHHELRAKVSSPRCSTTTRSGKRFDPSRGLNKLCSVPACDRHGSSKFIKLATSYCMWLKTTKSHLPGKNILKQSGQCYDYLINLIPRGESCPI